VNENGTVAWDSLIDDLTYPKGQFSAPTYPLKWSDGLAKACSDHVMDIGPCSARGDIGLDGTSLEDRINRYITWLDISESLAFARFSDNSGFDVLT